MALVKCPECGKEISDLASSCPYCGFPIGFESSINNFEQINNQYQYQKDAATRPDKEQKKEGNAGKTSALGILALVFSILGCTFWIGLILAVIDLYKRDGRKQTCSIIAICVSVLWIIIALFVPSATKSDNETSKVDTTTSTIEESKENEKIENTESSEAKAESNNKSDKDPVVEDIEILAEYTLLDSIGWYTRHFIILKNNSEETVDISTSSLAYDVDGEVVGAANANFEALGAGCTSVLYEAFETDKEIDHYETKMNVSRSEYYESVIQNLSYVENDIEDGAVFQVTNNGEDVAEFVEGYALFFLNGELVSFESTYFVDDDSEIKSGNTISKQLMSYKDFNSIEFYMTGRKYKY